MKQYNKPRKSCALFGLGFLETDRDRQTDRQTDGQTDGQRHRPTGMVWYGIVEFNVPLDTV